MSKTLPPSEGERRAISGYRPQHVLAATRILYRLSEGLLDWIRLVDPAAGRLDDFQIATPGRLDAFQVKWSRYPSMITFNALITPSGESPALIAQLSDGWTRLRAIHPGRRVVVHLVTDDSPSVNDGTIPTDAPPPSPRHFAAFVAQAWEPARQRPIPSAAVPDGWKATWEALRAASGLTPDDFDDFCRDCELEFRVPSPEPETGEGADARTFTDDLVTLTDFLTRAIASSEYSNAKAIHLSARELLARLGWTDRTEMRSRHEFPPPRFAYREIESTARRLASLIESLPGGYVGLVGPPGSGKSTLGSHRLPTAGHRFLRYFAFVPDSPTPQSLRGESVSLLHDLSVQIGEAGFHVGTALNRFDRAQLLQRLHLQLLELRRDWRENGRKTVILIDGLDHIPREQHPDRTFLADLPDPAEIPEGVIIVLGTQTTELDDLPVSIRTELRSPDRRIEMDPMTPLQVREFIAATPLSGRLNEEQQSLVTEISAGHPLMLSMLVDRLSEAPDEAAIAAVLLDEEPFAGRVDAKYERYWHAAVERPGDYELADLLAKVARIRGAVDLDWVESWAGRGVTDRLRSRLRHLFRRESERRWYFFHNSVRLFLRRKTAEGPEGGFERERDRSAHAALADRCGASPPDSAWASEELYHRAAGGDDRRVVALATPENFRRQFLGHRPAAVIAEDLRIALRSAAAIGDVIGAIRILLAWLELDARGTVLDGASFSFSEFFESVGDFQRARTFLREGDTLLVGRTRALEAAVSFDGAGYHEEASRLFTLAEPLGVLNGSEVLRDNGELYGLLSAWVAAAYRFRPFQEVLDLINRARPQLEHFPKGEDPDPEEECREVRRELLADLAEAACKSGATALIEGVVESFDANGADAPDHFELRFRTWSALRDASRYDDAREQVRRIVSRLQAGAIDVLSERQTAMLADMVFRSLRDRDLARELIAGLPQPELRTQGSESRFGPYWYRFRLNLVRFAVGFHDSAAAVVPDVEDPEHEGAQFFERGVVELARVSAHSWRGEPLRAGVLLHACRPLLRLFDRGRDRWRSHDSWSKVARVRGEFYSLLVRVVSESDAEVIPRLADEFDQLWWGRDELPPWPVHVVADVLIALYEHGMNRGWCEERLARVEEQWLTGIADADGRSRAHFEMAEQWRRLGAPDRARSLVKRAVEVGFGVGYRKDFQLNVWCKWVERANAADPSGGDHRVRTLIRCILACVGATEGDAATAASRRLIEMLFRVSPRRAAGLLRPLAETGVIDYEDGLARILVEALRADGAATVPAEVVIRHLLIPVSRSVHEDVLTAIVRAAPDAEVAARLAEAIAVFGAGGDRDAWMRGLWEACERFAVPLSEPAPAAHREADGAAPRRDRLKLKTGENLGVGEVIDRVRRPEDLMELRAAQESLSSFDWHVVFQEVCQRFGKEDLSRLKDLCGQNYSDLGLLRQIAERFIRIGEPADARHLLTTVLRAPVEYESELWSEKGAKCRAFDLLSSIDGEGAQDICLRSLAEHFVSGSAYAYSFQQAFDGVLISLAGRQITEAWDLIDRYLAELSRYSSEDDLALPEPASPDTPEESLLDILADLLDHPAHILDEAAKASLAELLARAESHQAVIGRFLNEGNSKLRAFLVVCDAVAGIRPDDFHTWHETLKGLARHRDWGIRALSRSVLKRLGLPYPEAPDVATELINNYTARALAAPPRLRPQQVAQDRPLPDSIDPREITRPFHSEIELLAKAAALPFDRILRRVRELMDEILPINSWNARAEQALRNRMEAAGLRFAFRRPRVHVVESAIRLAFAELTDGGRITGDAVGFVERCLRFWDAGLLLEYPERRPTEIPPMAYPEWGHPRERWIEIDSAEVDRAIARRVGEWIVLAEHTEIHSGAQRGPEEQRQSLVHGRAYDPETGGGFGSILPAVAKATQEEYRDAARYSSDSEEAEGATAVAHVHFTYETPGADWIAFEPGLARSLGWHPTDERLFAWRDDHGVVAKSVWWCDGHPAVRPRFADDRETAHGWLVLAEERALASITNAVGPLSRTARISRERGSDENEERRDAELTETLP